MDYFKSGLKTVLGSSEPGVQPSGAEIVERLIDRVNNSTLLEDRRDACRALKALSRKHRVEVGAQGLESLIQVIQLDRADCEIVSYALDALNNVISPTTFEEEEDNPKVTVNIGEQFTEMFLKNPQNVQLSLELLAEYEFKVRLSSIRLLIALLANRPKDIQEIVLVSPMGVSKLMDLLSDSREVVRNDALLLLIQLTKGNANIQKIVAFENAFDRLFEVISSEGYLDGGIVVEDCLLLMLNLLKNNSSNQTFFKEGSYIQRILPMLNIGDDNEDVSWSPQKVSNVHCMLQLIRTLVAPNNPGQLIASCQKMMRSVGLLDQLCNMLMASGVPADILTETINTVGEVIRGNNSNQEYLSNVMAPSNPPRPALVILLMSMVNEKQPFNLRCAVLYCFQCFLYRYEVGQGQLVQTLLPSTSEVSNLTSGQLLCGGLFSSDTLSNWFSAVALMHALVENPVQKEQLLRVLLATNIGSSPVSLLHQCTVLLQQGTKFHSKVALLMLLAVWTTHCPQAVSAFLNVPNSVSYLVAQTSSNEHDDNEYLLQGLCAFLLAICVHFNDNSVQAHSKESLHQLLIKRIGFETFAAKLSEVSKHEMYSRASKQPQLRATVKAELLLDYEFTKLFKVLESVLISSLSVEADDKQIAKAPEPKIIDDSALLEQYKSLIRQQDARLQEMGEQIETLLHQNNSLENKLSEITSEITQVKDENTLLKAQLSTSVLPYPSMERHNGFPENNNTTPVKQYDNDSSLKNEEKMSSLLSQINELKNQLELAEKVKVISTEELETLRKDQDDLLELLADQDSKISQYKMKLLLFGEHIDEDKAEENIPLV